MRTSAYGRYITRLRSFDRHQAAAAVQKCSILCRYPELLFATGGHSLYPVRLSVSEANLLDCAAVETRQPIVGAEPEDSVGGLCNCADRIGRQAVEDGHGAPAMEVYRRRCVFRHPLLGEAGYDQQRNDELE